MISRLRLFTYFSPMKFLTGAFLITLLLLTSKAALASVVAMIECRSSPAMHANASNEVAVSPMDSSKLRMVLQR